MIKQLRIIILLILLGTGTCLTAQNNTVTPLFAGKIGYHQYFGSDILLKDVVSPSGGTGLILYRGNTGILIQMNGVRLPGLLNLTMRGDAWFHPNTSIHTERKGYISEERL
ncbi:hypothetical protein NXX54_06870 [Bacteroides sp. BFG-638]|uniref:hypothetical protein n=1 Tax=Bacteroides sp. BFG-638 TaxID=2972765 RepID=UPI0021656C39|nr:hypothetical protein [Bacteroides sp. BFG-638]MCS2948115.1 hypothetical protein [Bacteroides sp. BFG-638]